MVLADKCRSLEETYALNSLSQLIGLRIMGRAITPELRADMSVVYAESRQ